MAALNIKIKTEFDCIPEVMVKKSIHNMKKRGLLMVGAEGRQFEGRRQKEE